MFWNILVTFPQRQVLLGEFSLFQANIEDKYKRIEIPCVSHMVMDMSHATLSVCLTLSFPCSACRLFSMYPCLYSCPANRFISTVFFFLFLTSFSITDCRFITLTRTDSNSFFLTAENYSIVYMCTASLSIHL